MVLVRVVFKRSLVMLDFMKLEMPVQILGVLYVLLVSLQILEQVSGQPRVVNVIRLMVLLQEHAMVLVRAVFKRSLVMLDFMKLEMPVQILGVLYVMLVPLQILEQAPGQPRVLLVPLVRIRCLRMLPRVRRVLLVRLQTLEQVLAQPRVLLVLLVCIPCLRTLPRVRLVLLVPLQILEQVPGQPRVLLVPLVHIHYLPTLRRVRLVPPLPTPPSNAPMVSTNQLKPVTTVTSKMLEVRANGNHTRNERGGVVRRMVVLIGVTFSTWPIVKWRRRHWVGVIRR